MVSLRDEPRDFKRTQPGQNPIFYCSLQEADRFSGHFPWESAASFLCPMKVGIAQTEGTARRGKTTVLGKPLGQFCLFAVVYLLSWRMIVNSKTMLGQHAQSKVSRFWAAQLGVDQLKGLDVPCGPIFNSNLCGTTQAFGIQQLPTKPPKTKDATHPGADGRHLCSQAKITKLYFRPQIRCGSKPLVPLVNLKENKTNASQNGAIGDAPHWLQICGHGLHNLWRAILGWMNIHVPPILMFTRVLTHSRLAKPCRWTWMFIHPKMEP